MASNLLEVFLNVFNLLEDTDLEGDQSEIGLSE